jgi:hypothetical protein
MLVRTVLSPSVFTIPPEEKVASYSLVIGLLQSLENNGIILVDDANSVGIDFYNKIQNWSKCNKFQKQAKKVLKQLHNKNRLVKVPVKGGFRPQCQEQPCQYCIEIARNELPIAFLARHECKSCTQSQLAMLSKLKVIDVEMYVLDEEFCSLINRCDRVFAPGEATQDKFEQEILIPLFREAKSVKIYDRYLGRSLLSQNKADNYKLTLGWILEVFKRESRKPRFFEVYGGFLTKSTDEEKRDSKKKKAGRKKAFDISEVENARCKLEFDLQRIFAEFKVIIKKETQGNELPHERYIITDQVAISVDRGSDLFLNKKNSQNLGELKDVHIGYCSDLGKIEQYVRRMPSLFS